MLAIRHSVPLVKLLTIPDQYGTLSVIDGQHRLFSYADDTVRERVGDNARIMVTAIRFRGGNPMRNSARIFVEINSNQTRIRPSHINAIAYEILGRTDATALAAQVILRVNDRANGRAFGLFDTSQTRVGVVAAPTVMTSLQPLLRIDVLRGLAGASSGAKARRRRGYEQLFGVQSVAALQDADTLIADGEIALSRYFNLLAREFHHDWPRRGAVNLSSLRHAKVLGGFVRLFHRFVGEGLSWQEVEQRIRTLRENLLQVRGMPRYTRRIFDERYPARVPDAGPSLSANVRFLSANLSTPTPFSEVLARRAARRSSKGAGPARRSRRVLLSPSRKGAGKRTR
jgi:hypothetical protein